VCLRAGELAVHERTVQYVASAATLPSSGLRSVEGTLLKIFPQVRPDHDLSELT
jgi:hypothetical protein